MKKEEEFPKIGNERSTYEWTRILDGSIWRMERGKDFKTPINDFRRYCYKKAKEFGMTVSTRSQGKSLWIQAHHPKRTRKK